MWQPVKDGGNFIDPDWFIYPFQASFLSMVLGSMCSLLPLFGILDHLINSVISSAPVISLLLPLWFPLVMLFVCVDHCAFLSTSAHRAFFVVFRAKLSSLFLILLPLFISCSLVISLIFPLLFPLVLCISLSSALCLLLHLSVCGHPCGVSSITFGISLFFFSLPLLFLLILVFLLVYHGNSSISAYKRLPLYTFPKIK